MLNRFKSLTERTYPSWAEIRAASLLALAVVALPTVFIWLLTTEPISWLPKTSEVNTLLSALLGAQAAITALTLAVTLFVIQGVSTRRDADDRIYDEYIRQSWVLPIFIASMGSVLASGAVLMAQASIGDAADLNEGAASARNLTPLAAVAFIANLVFAGALFKQAIRLARPSHWRQLRRDVNRRDVNQAVQAFLARFHRAIMSRVQGSSDLTTAFPDDGEELANHAIAALLDDARRAMAERRQEVFDQSLDAIKELVMFAMDEMEKVGIPWSAPGSSAEWPPLRELGRNLYPFKEEVIRGGQSEYIMAVLGLDYWLVTNGFRRSCGELFSTGLNGYRWNYQISTRLEGQEVRELLRDRFSLNLNGLTYRSDRRILPAFAVEMVKHQERILSDAMHADQSGDYEQLHIGFTSRFWDILRYQNSGQPLVLEEAGLADELEQQYRIGLMGLAGRAVHLAGSDGVNSETPYLRTARETYPRLRELGDDVAVALEREGRAGFSLWHEWEMRDSPPGQAILVSAERYPLTFFAIRLMELAIDPALSLDLHGKARQALDWFIADSGQVEKFVQATPGPGIERRRELAIAILEASVAEDTADEEREIVGRELSEDRVSEFRAGVEKGAQIANAIEFLLGQGGILTTPDSVAEDVPEERGFRRLLPKAYFMEPAESDQTYYAPIEGDGWGRGLTRDAIDLLCESLADADGESVPLESSDALFKPQSTEEMRVAVD